MKRVTRRQCGSDSAAVIGAPMLLPDDLVDRFRRVPGHPAALCGAGAAEHLDRILDHLWSRRCVVVHGRSSYAACGAASHVAAATAGRLAGFIVATSDQTTIEAVVSGAERAAALAPDTVIGLGGGSTLDLAKAIATQHRGDSRGAEDAIRRNEVGRRACHLVLLPTTAGSGSELTRFATIWDGERKLSLDALELRADVALIDPNLAASTPPRAAAAAAADALAQSVEGCWAIGGTPASRKISRAAFDTIVPTVADLCRGRLSGDASLRDRMAWGAALAGAAIDVSRTTAAHALSYALTGRFGIPHGAAVAMLLPWVIAHNRGACVENCRWDAGPAPLRQIIDDLDKLCVASTGSRMSQLVRELLRVGGYAENLAGIGCERSELTAEWVRATNSPRMHNNPRTVTHTDIARLLEDEATSS